MESAARKTAKRTSAGGRSATAARSVKGIESFASTYLASPIERVETIRRGLPAAAIVQTSEAMNLSREQIYGFLHFPRATVTRKIAAKAVLSPEMTERLLGLRKLIGQVEVMVRESGNPEGFNAAEWVAQWLNTPSPALRGQPPSAFMDTAEGQELVAGLIARMQSGAYA